MQKKANKSTSDIQTHPNHFSFNYGLSLFMQLSSCALSFSFLNIYFNYIHLTGLSCHSVPIPPLCAFSAWLYMLFLNLSHFARSLISRLKNMIFFFPVSVSADAGSFVCPVPAWRVLCKKGFIPFSLFLPSYRVTIISHPLPCTPPPSILLKAWQKPTLPCLPASAPFILLPGRHTEDREEEREKERAPFVCQRLQTAT